MVLGLDHDWFSVLLNVKRMILSHIVETLPKQFNTTEYFQIHFYASCALGEEEAAACFMTH